MRTRALAVLALAAVALLAGCASPHSLSDAAPSGVPTPKATEQFGEPTADDDLVIRYGDQELRIASMDAALNLDAIPDDLPAITADEVYVFVRPAGWTLSAMQFTGDPYECGERSLGPEQEDLGGGWWAIRAIGPAGDYTLQVTAASGPGLPLGGTVGASGAYIALTTTQDRPLPPAGATLDVAVYDGEPGMVSLSLTGMESSPESATAAVTVTGSSGESVDLTLEPLDDVCWQIGEQYLKADLTQAQNDALGAGSYDYEIELVLDGQTHRATGSTQDGGSVGTPVFTPALP